MAIFTKDVHSAESAIVSLSVPPSVSMTTVDISPKIKAGMTPKKSHEVRAKLILNARPFHDFSFIR